LTLLNRGKTNSLAKNKDVWSDEDGDQELNQDQVSCRLIWNHLISELELSWKNKWKTVTTHPCIPFVTLVCLAVLLSISIIITIQLNKTYRAQKQIKVKDLAYDTGRWFSGQLKIAVSPLFTLREFVKETSVFHDLPYLIGQGGEPGSAPYINSSVIKYRNVSGICYNSTIQEEFDRIAKSIKDSSKGKGAIVAMNLSPHDVACIFYPLNNTEDFTPPLYLDNSGAIGQDLLKDPTRIAIMLKTHQSDSFTVAGPMSLAQCSGCPPAVRVGFVARLPVNMPGYNIYAGGVNYTSWGFVAAVLNWEKIINQTNFQERFENNGFQFELRKTDRILNTSTNQFYDKVRYACPS
jgi:sensor domain CHASE-containing protein